MRNLAGRHRRLFLAGAGFVLLLEAAGWAPPREMMVLLLVVLVALAGLPHGALDPLVARKAALWKTPAGFAAFIGCCLFLATCALALWLKFPAPALAIFLAYSAWHFSGDWRNELPAFRRLWVGLTIVTVPALSHPAEVNSIYGVLAAPAIGT